VTPATGNGGTATTGRRAGAKTGLAVAGVVLGALAVVVAILLVAAFVSTMT
jgi:hypothetical protein